MRRWLLEWLGGSINRGLQDDLRQALNDLDHQKAVNGVLEAENERLWKLVERDHARVDRERASFARGIAEDKVARAATNDEE